MEEVNSLQKFIDEHHRFSSFISSLDANQFTQIRNGKWSPAQQLNHINLCLTPIAKAMNAKAYLLGKFGTLNRPQMDEETVISTYKAALSNGGKAPDQFVPQAVVATSMNELVAELETLLTSIRESGIHFSETEFNTIVMPHPLLGNLSINEMLWLMTYHAEHHLLQTQQNLVAF